MNAAGFSNSSVPVAPLFGPPSSKLLTETHGCVQAKYLMCQLILKVASELGNSSRKMTVNFFLPLSFFFFFNFYFIYFLFLSIEKFAIFYLVSQITMENVQKC